MVKDTSYGTVMFGAHRSSLSLLIRTCFIVNVTGTLAPKEQTVENTISLSQHNIPNGS